MTMRLALISPSIVAKPPAAGKPNRLTKMKQSNRSNAPRASSGGTDPDVRTERIEDDTGGRLWKEIRRFLGHHLACASDLNHVRNRRRPHQEGSPARRR